jgi:hypothetical protein
MIETKIKIIINFLLFLGLAIVSIISILVGSLSMPKISNKYYIYKSKEKCDNALVDAKKFDNEDSCPIWNGSNCSSGIYEDGKCNPKSKIYNTILIFSGIFGLIIACIGSFFYFKNLNYTDVNDSPWTSEDLREYDDYQEADYPYQQDQWNDYS